MSKEPEPLASIFPVGSDEQRQVDKFLSRFPNERAAHFRKIFATGSSVLAAEDPELQREIDAIYKALEKRAETEPRRIIPHRPGPVEAGLIEEFLKTMPAQEVEQVREAFHAANARLDSSDPEIRKRIDAIYQAREDEALASRNPAKH